MNITDFIVSVLREILADRPSRASGYRIVTYHRVERRVTLSDASYCLD